MSDEVFRRLPVPDSTFNAGEEYQKLSCLLFIISPIQFMFPLRYGWVMDEFGVDGMREKLVTVECSQRLQWPSAFWKNEVVIMADRVGKLCCYDFGTQEINLHAESRFSQSEEEISST